ncbi:MAG: tyrosine-type recombinase/integrase, partial [Acidobacteriales bacterium]|nr:tyrosine-type recombinase/integrase [Terriglobales bacterium]
FDAATGSITIEQRWDRGDVDEPKTLNSRRVLALGSAADDYRKLTAGMEPDAYIFARNDGSGEPLWDSTVREALKAAARAAGCDFLGFGMHSFRRANITWRQLEGATSIEAQKTAGHSKVSTTMDYTQIELSRQLETILRIQQRLIDRGGSLQSQIEPKMLSLQREKFLKEQSRKFLFLDDRIEGWDRNRSG